MNLTPRAAQKKLGSARRMRIWTVALATLVLALVPLIFDPNAVILYVPAAFYFPKFKLLMYLSAALLVAVAGATLLGARPVKLPVLLPALAFLGVSTLSTLFSGDIMRSLVGEINRHDGLLSLAAGVLLFYAAARFLDSWAKARLFLAAGVASAVLVSLYGVLQHLGLDPVAGRSIPWYDGTERAFSTLGNPLFLAAYLTLAMGATVALYFSTESRWERGLCLSILVLMGACWLYAYSRGAMLGAALGLPVLLWLSYLRMGKMRPLFLPAAVLAVAVVAASQIGSAGGAERTMSTGGDSALSAITRVYIWRDTVPVILERPVLGHGPDNFAEPFGRHEGEDLKVATFNPARGVSDTVDKAHNELLQVAATTGLLGLAAYLWIFFSYFRNAYRSGGWAIIALSGGVLAYILQLQTAFSTIATSVTFWAVLGVSVAIMRLREQESAKEDLESGHREPWLQDARGHQAPASGVREGAQ